MIIRRNREFRDKSGVSNSFVIVLFYYIPKIHGHRGSEIFELFHYTAVLARIRYIGVFCSMTSHTCGPNSSNHVRKKT